MGLGAVVVGVLGAGTGGGVGAFRGRFQGFVVPSGGGLGWERGWAGGDRDLWVFKAPGHSGSVFWPILFISGNKHT